MLPGACGCDKVLIALRWQGGEVGGFGGKGKEARDSVSVSHPCNALCLMWVSSCLQTAGVSNGVGGGVVELDENGSVVMGGEKHDPSPLQGITGGASSEDLDSLQALRGISQVSFAAP